MLTAEERAQLERGIEEDRRVQQEVAERYGGPVESFLTGAVDAIGGPIRSIVQSFEAPEVIELERKLARRHRLAGALGQLTGFAAGAVTGTGVPGILVGAGRGTAKALGGKFVGRLAQGAIEGGGIALSEATGKSMIDRSVGRPGAADEIAESVGVGMALGAGVGLAAWAFPAMGNALFRTSFGKQIANVNKAKAELSKFGQEYNKLTSELEELVSSPGLSIKKTFRINQLIGGRQTRQTGGHLPQSGKEFFYGEGSLIDAAKKGMQNADKRVRKPLGDALVQVAETARYGAQEGTMDAILMLGGAPPIMAIRKISAPVLRAAQRMIFSGIKNNKPVRAILSASLHEGRLTSQKLVREGAGFVARPTRYTKYFDVAGDLASALKVPPIIHLSTDQYNEISNELLESDPLQLDKALRLAMASRGVPQEVVGPMVDQQLRIHQYLLESLPPAHQPKWVAKEDTTTSDVLIQSFARKMRAAQVPATVVHDFLNGTLTREAAEAWWRTQPGVAEFIASELSKMIDTALLYGKKFTPDEKKQLGLMIDPSGRLLGRNKSAGLIQLLQGNYMVEQSQTPPPQPGGPPAPGTPKAVAGMSNSSMSPSQALGQRLSER